MDVIKTTIPAHGGNDNEKESASTPMTHPSSSVDQSHVTIQFQDHGVAPTTTLPGVQTHAQLAEMYSRERQLSVDLSHQLSSQDHVLHDLSTKYQQCQRDNADLHAQLHKARSEQQHAHQLTAHRARSASTTAGLVELAYHNAQAAAAVHEAEVRGLREDIGKRETYISHLKDNVEKLEHDIAALEDKNDILRDNLRAEHNQYIGAAQKRDFFEKGLVAAKLELEACRGKVGMLERDLNEAEDTIQRLQVQYGRDLEGRKRTVAKLEKELADNKALVEGLEGRNVALEQRD
jgi:chromosome segregation ATPase